MSDQQLPHRWGTPRLVVRDAVPDDIPALQQINDALHAVEGWTGVETDAGAVDSLAAALEDGVLPPGGSQARFRMQALQLHDGGQLVGFLVVYHGFPDHDTLWINVLAIAEEHQGQGLGQEVICELRSIAAGLPFARIRLSASLRNWPALRFWTRAGFRTIVRMAGDKVLTDATFAHLVLEQSVEHA